ncbi:Multidrug resistance protein MdtK [Paenibacillus auburnensis]|uniref:Probable multidrug resistance protein NorM n=1 Tax=Paenibacillus auburnensis TaxID=2905649 RepID=A0ABM9BNX8_9BACL|nr:Multidrug resistance protein MdtK [Paenibacillus auburnensis]
MKQTHSLKQKAGQFLHILFPILITQIALSAITFFDTNMSGKFGTNDLAGVAIGTSLWIPIQTGLSGILMGITPIVSHLLGSKKIRMWPTRLPRACGFHCSFLFWCWPSAA